MISRLLEWPLLRQLRRGADGTGPEAMSRKTREISARHEDAEVSRSVCPYVGVGCGQLVYHEGDELVAIEGDPASPVNQGILCPKGSMHCDVVPGRRPEDPEFVEWFDRITSGDGDRADRDVPETSEHGRPAPSARRRAE